MAGAIGPRKKRSQQKKRIRHGVWQTINVKRIANMLALTTCQNCGSKKLSHRACQQCGWYKGKQILTIKVKTPGTIVDA